jgi:hypothetical protein
MLEQRSSTRVKSIATLLPPIAVSIHGSLARKVFVSDHPRIEVLGCHDFVHRYILVWGRWLNGIFVPFKKGIGVLILRCTFSGTRKEYNSLAVSWLRTWKTRSFH